MSEAGYLVSIAAVMFSVGLLSAWTYRRFGPVYFLSFCIVAGILAAAFYANEYMKQRISVGLTPSFLEVGDLGFVTSLTTGLALFLPIWLVMRFAHSKSRLDAIFICVSASAFGTFLAFFATSFVFFVHTFAGT